MRPITLSEYKARYFDESLIDGPVSLTETGREDGLLPRRRPVSHKYSYGRALIIGGALGYSGAPVLAANACERGGAGLTHLLTPESVYPIAASRCDGAVVTPLPATEQGGISRDALTTILPLLRSADACALGPGLGLGEDAELLVTEIVKAADCPLVLDADALTLCGRHMELLDARKAPLLLTPHGGEFKRLGGELKDGRLAGALRFTEAHGNLILILKGHGTLVCAGREVSVNPTGSPAMAKGGSGDVLCGLLCALLAQGFGPLFAARCAVYLHGLAGDLAAGEYGEYAVRPSDLTDFLPKAMKRCQEAAPDAGNIYS